MQAQICIISRRASSFQLVGTTHLTDMNRTRSDGENRRAAPPIGLVFSVLIVVMPCIGACAAGSGAVAGPGNAMVTGNISTMPASNPSLDDIVVLAQRINNPGVVIERIRETGAHFRLSAADVISLRERGLPLAVIEHILAAERQLPAEVAGKIPPSKQNAAPPVASARTWPLLPALYQGL